MVLIIPYFDDRGIFPLSDKSVMINTFQCFLNTGLKDSKVNYQYKGQSSATILVALVKVIPLLIN